MRSLLVAELLASRIRLHFAINRALYLPPVLIGMRQSLESRRKNDGHALKDSIDPTYETVDGERAS